MDVQQDTSSSTSTNLNRKILRPFRRTRVLLRKVEIHHYYPKPCIRKTKPKMASTETPGTSTGGSTNSKRQRDDEKTEESGDKKQNVEERAPVDVHPQLHQQQQPPRRREDWVETTAHANRMLIQALQAHKQMKAISSKYTPDHQHYVHHQAMIARIERSMMFQIGRMAAAVGGTAPQPTQPEVAQAGGNVQPVGGQLALLPSSKKTG